MKIILLWLQGWLEIFLDIITWPFFHPYYKAIYANKIREELTKKRKAEKESKAALGED